jgi:quercetin dioxygenase-like cupin family protein
LSKAPAELLKSTGIRFASRAAGTSDDWHTAPQRQYLVTLKGTAEIEVGGGKRIQAPTGSVLLIEDTTGKGHRAHVTKDSEWHVLFIPVGSNPPDPTK